MIPRGEPGPQQRAQASAIGATRRITIPKLPKPDGLVAAVEYNILPPTEQLLKEIFRRCPWLQDQQFIEWFGKMRSHQMPKAESNEKGKGICGCCGSNIFGNPIKKHSMSECGVPLAVRAQFMAVNTRSICYACNGKSDSHDICVKKNDVCGYCEETGQGRRHHTPATGACSIPYGCEHEQVTIWRKQHYRQVELESQKEALEIKLHNDSPLLNPPRKCKYPVIGHQAFFDERKMFGVIQYTEYATYPGVIPQMEKEKRKEVEKQIQQVRRNYYEIDQPNRPKPSTEIQHRIQQHREAMEQVTRLKNEGYQVEIVEENDSEEDPSNDAQDNQVQEGVRSDESVEHHDPQVDKERSRSYLTEIALWQTGQRSLKLNTNNSQYYLTNEETTEQFWIKAKQVAGYLKECPEHIKETWTRVAQNKVSVEKTETTRETPEKHKVNKEELKEQLGRAAASKYGNSLAWCTILQSQLTGMREATKRFNDGTDEDPTTEWTLGYTELIIRLATIIALSKAEVWTRLSTGNVRFSTYQPTGKEVIWIPDTTLYKALPTEERDAFFAIFTVNVANRLL